jgi:hypothetical protein
MHFMYVDESGDPGPYDLSKPPNLRASRHYIVSGFVIPADEWRHYLTRFLDLRRYLKKKYGFPVRAELHGTELINARHATPHRLIRSRRKRVELYRDVLTYTCKIMPRARILNVHLDKEHPQYEYTRTPDGIQMKTWERLLERYNMYLQKDCNGDSGMIFADETNEIGIRRLVRQVRVHHVAGSHFGGSYPLLLENLVEDPIMRKSESSYFVQIADLITHSLYRKLYPKGSLKRHNVDKLFDCASPLLHLPASRRDPHRQGIVHC